MLRLRHRRSLTLLCSIPRPPRRRDRHPTPLPFTRPNIHQWSPLLRRRFRIRRLTQQEHTTLSQLGTLQRRHRALGILVTILQVCTHLSQHHHRLVFRRSPLRVHLLWLWIRLQCQPQHHRRNRAACPSTIHRISRLIALVSPPRLSLLLKQRARSQRYLLQLQLRLPVRIRQNTPPTGQHIQYLPPTSHLIRYHQRLCPLKLRLIRR